MALRTFALLLWSAGWLFPVLGQTPEKAGAGSKVVPGSKEQWDENFRDPAIRRTEPDDLLVKAIANRTPGLAIDLGMGQGRNALYLAENGWRTTGVDFSEVAVADARTEARKRGLKLDSVVADLATYDLGKEKWDLILYSYMQSWLKKSTLDHARLVRAALRPGGVLVIEGFAGKEAPTALAFETNELLRTFADFKILFYEDTEAVPKWGRQRVKRRTVRLIAQRE